MKKIGVIADTHDTLKSTIIDNLKSCDYILHAGDITNIQVLKQLEKIGKLIVVKGNNDTTLDLPKNITVTIEGYTIFMTHKQIDIPKDLSNIDIVIYGHSHKYEEYIENGIQFLNPGGCGRRRFSLPLTMSYLYISKNQYQIEKIEI